MKLKINLAIYPNLIFTLSIFAIVFALILQFFFNMEPCKLCLIQRIPYYLIILCGVISLIMRNSIIQEIYVALATILLFVVAALAFYHAGIEYGLFKNIFGCEAASNATNIQELKESILNAKIVPCDKPAFHYILSLSGWNFLFAFTLGIFGVSYYITRK